MIFIIKLGYKKLMKLFYDDSKLKKISKNAKETILNNYKLEKFYDFLNQLTKISN